MSLMRVRNGVNALSGGLPIRYLPVCSLNMTTSSSFTSSRSTPSLRASEPPSRRQLPCLARSKIPLPPPCQGSVFKFFYKHLQRRFHPIDEFHERFFWPITVGQISKPFFGDEFWPIAVGQNFQTLFQGPIFSRAKARVESCRAPIALKCSVTPLSSPTDMHRL